MKNRLVAGIILVLLGIFGYCADARADPEVKIRIEGKLRELSPPAQIINNRTMVPIRFIIEDEALNGKVYWDEKESKVALDCKGRYIEFVIGEKKALLDGEMKYFDAAPYINRDRTFVPLRFLVENLGAIVSWKSQEREVGISFNYTPKIFAYYYYHGFDELKKNAHLFTDVAFRWFATNERGELFYEYQDDYEEILQFCQGESIKTHASVVLMEKEPLHKLLSSKESRQRLCANLLDKVNGGSYDGVNIDFEFIDPTDAEKYCTFLRELKTYLGTEKCLSVAVFAKTGKENWPSAYDYEKIGQIVDQLIVMAYDYSYINTDPGPIAPLWWVEDVLSYASRKVPREKILLGLPTYGYDWAPDLPASTVTGKKLQKIASRYTLKENFDESSMSPCFYYYDDKKILHQIWMENNKSIREKLLLANNSRIGGISFWRIGNDFNELYELLENYPEN